MKEKNIQHHTFIPVKTNTVLNQYLTDTYGSIRGYKSATIVQAITQFLKKGKYL
jgi:hypothetical protein